MRQDALPYTIAPLAEHEDKIPALASFLGECFGARQDQEKLIRDWLADSSRLSLIATTAEEIVGVCVVRLGSARDAAGYMEPFGDKATARLAQLQAPVGLFQMMATSPQHKQRGVGSSLGLHALHWLERQGATALIGISWGHGEADHSGHLFERGEFERVGSVEGFYQRFNAQSGQRCSRCASADRPTCQCVAHLYVRRLER